jgi:preprotein translocase subunit SecG
MKILIIAQVAISVLLMVSILMQNRGASLSGIFGGSDNVFRTKRGVEKILFISSIILAVLFLLVSLLAMVINSRLTS